MGWTNDHLHEFVIRRTRFGTSHDPLGGPLQLENELDEEDYRLSELGLRARSKLVYDYDYGDSWRHDIVLEKVLPLEPGFVPACIDGARACPPEDSGGAWGYEEKLAALADPTDPDHDDMAGWLGRDFDPEAFPIEKINLQLASLGRNWMDDRSPS